MSNEEITLTVEDTLTNLGDFAPRVHTHVKADVTDFEHTHERADITDFAHTHERVDITDFDHTHTSAEITDLGTGTLTITQGGETLGTFNANATEDATINLSGGGVSADELAAETTRAKAAEETNAQNIATEITRANAKETELAQSIETETARATAAEQANTNAITAETTRAKAREDAIEGEFTKYAPLASPTFSGICTAPTADTGDKSLQIANTKFVDNSMTLLLDSPAFTGTPTAPTAAAGTTSTQIATCAFVADAINTAITEVENGSY